MLNTAFMNQNMSSLKIPYTFYLNVLNYYITSQICNMLNTLTANNGLNVYCRP